MTSVVCTLRKMLNDVPQHRQRYITKLVLSYHDYQALKNELFALGHGVAPALLPRIAYFDGLPCEKGPRTTVVSDFVHDTLIVDPHRNA